MKISFITSGPDLEFSCKSQNVCFQGYAPKKSRPFDVWHEGKFISTTPSITYIRFGVVPVSVHLSTLTC